MRPSGEQHVISAGPYRAVAVEVGGGLREATVDGRPLLDGFAEDARADGARGQVLAPWPNRLRDGRWTWQGAAQQLPLTEPEKGNASHGLLRWVPWTAVRAGEDAVRLEGRVFPQPGYEFRLDVTAEYRVDPESGLSVVLTATNAGDAPAPVALGQHPYLAAPDGGLVDGCALQVPARTRILVDERSLPTGTAPVDGTEADLREPTLLGGRVLDLAYTDLTGDTVRLSAGGRTTVLTHDGQWVQVFTGDTLAPARRRRGVAVEPLTAPADALASGTGLRVLEPGASTSLSWSVRSEQD
jgi:aldose 1-epimerase